MAPGASSHTHRVGLGTTVQSFPSPQQEAFFRNSRDIAQVSEWSTSSSGRFIPSEKTQIPAEYGIGWVPQVISRFYKRGNFYIHVTVHRNKFLFNNQPDASLILIYSFIKHYMFRVSSLPIIRSFLLYIRHWYVSCRFDDRFQAS